MDMWTTSQAAAAWDTKERWVRDLAQQGRIPGAIRQGRRWAIPRGTPKPVDERKYRWLDLPRDLQTRFATIDALSDELKRRRPLTEGELTRLRKEFTIEYTYDSNAIEGSTLTLRETALILEGVTIGEKSLKEHLEAIGHRNAYEYVEDLAVHQPHEQITSRVIRDIHFLVRSDRPQERGAFRTVGVRILGTTHKPPEPILVPELIDELLDEYQKDHRRHPIEKAARFHLGFESIHPFIDGNGRTGRLLLNLMLLHTGYLPVNIKYTDRQRYYDCFQAWDEKRDSQPMTALVAEYAEQRLREWISILDTALPPIVRTTQPAEM